MEVAGEDMKKEGKADGTIPLACLILGYPELTSVT